MSTWAKVELTDELNKIVERHQELNNVSKPEAINIILRSWARDHYATYPEDFGEIHMNNE